MSAIGIETEKISIKDELCGQYNWFYHTVLQSIQAAGNDFFPESFDIRLVSLSKNVNVLFQGDDYFVTKIRIDKNHDAFFRCSAPAVNLILERALGPAKKFNISNITELEAKIISSFNDYLYGHVSKVLLPPPPKTQKRKNFDTIHLTCFLVDRESGSAAKIIVSLPAVLLAPEILEQQAESFDVSSFTNSKIDVNIKIGSTTFSLKDLKSLEKDDIVVFENSNIHIMELKYGGYETLFNITPNPGIIISANEDNNGGHIMEGQSFSQNLWDNIQVEMGAEFEKVKITLGELKGIEQGLVLDLSSVYNNKIFLKVENKTIAKGELVIINDRYGVRIDEVYASEPAQEAYMQEHPQEQYQEEGVEGEGEEFVQEEGVDSDEEFDYSDFELDDQDI